MDLLSSLLLLSLPSSSASLFLPSPLREFHSQLTILSLLTSSLRAGEHTEWKSTLSVPTENCSSYISSRKLSKLLMFQGLQVRALMFILYHGLQTQINCMAKNSPLVITWVMHIFTHYNQTLNVILSS